MLRWLRHSYGVFDEKRSIGPARWPHHDLLFVHEGSVALAFPGLGRDLILNPGEGVLIWPRTEFHGQPQRGPVRASIQHFEITRGANEGLAWCVGQKNGFSAQTAAPSADLSRDIERAVALARSQPPVDTSVRLALLSLILAEGGFATASAKAPSDTRLAFDELQAWLRINLTRNPGVSELARQAGLSASRFRTVFLEERKQTVGEFIRQHREDEARRQLVETRLPLKEIALALGYADAVVFHRAFKSRVGQTPGVFRRKNRVHG